MGKFLKKFSTTSERDTYENGESYLEPYVSLTTADNSVHYNKPPFFCKLTLQNGDVVEIEGSGELTHQIDEYRSSVIISAEIGEACTSIGDYAFNGCGSITSVTIPNSVTSIGALAFAMCTNLEYINIPNSITSIGGSSFVYCGSLKGALIIPNSVTSIGNTAFEYCSGLTEVVISNNLTSIGDYTFYGCYNLISVAIPSNITSIGDNAFKECHNLTLVTIESTTPPTLGYTVFNNNASGRKICVPKESVATYKTANMWSNYANDISPMGYAFTKYNVTSTSSPTTLRTNYEQNIFKSMEIDGTVLNNLVTEYTFNSTGSHIVNYELYDETKVGNSAPTFYNGNLREAIIPYNVTNIGSNAFLNCSGLTSVIIPDSVTSIGSASFNGCSNLTSIIMPSTITDIGSAAFYGCTSLSSVTFTTTTPPTLGSGAFINNASGRKIYVPTDSVEAYKAASGWSDYAIDIEAIP